MVVVPIGARGAKQDVHSKEVFIQEIYQIGSKLNLDHYREQHLDGQMDMS